MSEQFPAIPVPSLDPASQQRTLYALKEAVEMLVGARDAPQALRTLGTLMSRDGALQFLTDAPADGVQYARRDNAWEEVVAGGGGGSGLPEAPLDGLQYARQSGFWTPIAPPSPTPRVLALSISAEGTDIVPGVVGYAHWPFIGQVVAELALGLSEPPSGGSLSLAVDYWDGTAWASVFPDYLPAVFPPGVDFRRISPGPGLDDDADDAPPPPPPLIPLGAKLRFVAAGPGTGARALKAYIVPAMPG